MTRRNGPLAALVVTGLLIPLASGCGGTTGQRPAPIGALAACRLLRADAAGRAGHRPDNRTLRLIADRLEHGEAVPGPMDVSFIAA